MSTDVNDEPLKSVIQNCRRLIADAELLLRRGSAGSACSLAIMAFEEAGKGFSHELDWKKTRKSKINSQHQFRHLMCSIILLSSLHDKHGLTFPSFTDQQRDEIRERFEAAKSFSDFALSPASDEIRTLIGGKTFKEIDMLPHDQRMVAYVEMNWLKKVAKLSMTGELEKLRQKGFYIDFNDQGLLSRPDEISRNDAFKWIWAAKRAVNLLAFGLYRQPYSELAALLESQPKPLPDVGGIFEMLRNLMGRADEVREPAAPGYVDEDFKPYEPFGDLD